MKKLLVANYKMNGNINFYQKVSKVLNRLKSEDTIVLCPPFVYMPFLKIKNENMYLGSQDIAMGIDKKSTGQTSAVMLNEFGVKYAIIGHSERREIGETDAVIAKKVEIAHQYDITPIVCVGEKSKTDKLDILKKQVETALKFAQNKHIVFAYEPVWAIGTGEQPTIEKINSAISLIKKTAKKCGFEISVLYGGSVNLSNYKEVAKAEIDGYLMGGVSLKIEDFVSIIKGEWWIKVSWWF